MLVGQQPGGANGAFLDKPWIAVDIPRGNAGRVQHHDRHRSADAAVAHGHADGAGRARSTSPTRRSRRTRQGERADIYFTVRRLRRTWTTPVRVERPRTTASTRARRIAIDPRNGAVLIAWRRFAPATPSASGDGIMIAALTTAIAPARLSPPGSARRKLPSARSTIQAVPRRTARSGKHRAKACRRAVGERARRVRPADHRHQRIPHASGPTPIRRWPSTAAGRSTLRGRSAASHGPARRGRRRAHRDVDVDQRPTWTARPVADETTANEGQSRATRSCRR